MLVMWEFGNFKLPAIIMAPIPLTLIGIIPGHWLFGAEFTATSMIGFIALAGIIVRNSILLADFSKRLVDQGVPVQEAVIEACRARTRPIMITALALVAGSSVILSDPIFQGMAISLMFGVMVSTLLTLVVIPLKCATIDPKKVYGCASGVQTFNAALAGGPAVAVADVGISLNAPSAEKKDWSQGKIRLLWVIPAMIGIFAWTALMTFVAWVKRWKWVQKLVPVLAMVGYALRALPYFVMLFVKDTYARWRENRAHQPQPAPAPAPAPTPAPAPAPAPQAKPEPKPEAEVKPEPKLEPEVVKPKPEVKTTPVQKAPDQKAPVQKAPTKKKTPAKKAVVEKTPAAKPTSKPAAKPAAKPTTEAKTQAKQELKAKPKSKPKVSAKVRPKSKRRGIRLKKVDNGSGPDPKMTPVKDQGDET